MADSSRDPLVVAIHELHLNFTKLLPFVFHQTHQFERFRVRRVELKVKELGSSPAEITPPFCPCFFLAFVMQPKQTRYAEPAGALRSFRGGQETCERLAYTHT